MATRDEVESFLHHLRDKMRGFDVAFRPRNKNLEYLAELDILPSDRLAYIKKLTADNYHSGFRKDNYDPTELDYYEFGIEIKGTEVYIKISIGQQNKLIDCMSFHKAERAMLYPLR